MTEATAESSEPDQQADPEDYHPSLTQFVFRASNRAGFFGFGRFRALHWRRDNGRLLIFYPL